jgi:hypothetical protein
VSGFAISFLDEMSEQIRSFRFGSGRTNVVFVIGRILKGHINKARAIFGNGDFFDDRIGPANYALYVYEF